MQWFFTCDDCGHNNEVSEQLVSKRIRGGEFRCRNCSGGYIDDRCWRCPDCGRYHGFSQGQSTTVSCSCGFKNKSDSGGCFITTATCLALGKGDKCEELETFRHFRDTYVNQHHFELIKKYYEIAPLIVDSINTLENADELYRQVWIENLLPILKKIKNKNQNEAMVGYEQMVDELEKTYLN